MKWSLRAKLFLFVPVLAALPWLGFQTYERLTQFAVQAQTDSLRTIADILHAALETEAFDPQVASTVLTTEPLTRSPTLDGFFDEWPVNQPSLADNRMALRVGQFDGTLVFGLDVSDRSRFYREPQFGRAAPIPFDAVRFEQHSKARALIYELATEAPGRFQVEAEAPTPLFSKQSLTAFWWEDASGYRLEWSLPVNRLLDAPIELTVIDHDGLTATPTRYQFRVAPMIPAVQALARRLAADSRHIVIVTDRGRVLAQTTPTEGHYALKASDRNIDGARLTEAHVVLNAPRVMRDGTTVHVLVSATRSELVGRSQEALFNLAWQMLGVLGLLVGGLTLYSGRLAERITRLRNEVKNHLDGRGRLNQSPRLPETAASDEVGALSRDVQRVLDDLARYTGFLERIPRTLRHELSNPMSAIQTSLELLSDESDPSEQARLRATAERGIQKLESTLSQVTEAASLEEALRVDTHRLFDVGQVVDAAIETARLSAPGFRWEVNRPEGVLLIAGSDLRFEQLLDKLVDNALDFTPEGGRIRVTLQDQITAVDVHVENDGPPFKRSDDLDPFQMFSGSRNDATGHHLGLGLYIVRLIAESMGAAPQIENTERGVRITLKGFRTDLVTQ